MRSWLGAVSLHGVTRDDMPQPYRNTFILRKLYDCDQDDIATRLGISRRSVERHIATGLAYLLKAGSDDS
ncbi:sigma factor-like helix-turn-helix DNA-binding protein [Gluconobacter aidae]|uniref:RNA polymerase sigma factor 70 region 4 type 2 domain-containing protein n=1 Tax=Gluconobacter aidae TaxID=2662454 RepID=A0A7X1VNM0_9PROT|nr:sigma factor-like helix-turn-helix DNA-binding protein [Gluconobacter aidae]MQR99464.1 hypothetical protein [Gluconobacter aidae]